MNKAIAYQRNKIARLRKQLKWANRENILGLSYFNRRANETIEERLRIIKNLGGEDEKV